MRKILLSLLVLLAAPRAHAELWSSSLGELLAGATSIEIISVDGVAKDQASGKIVRSIRGRKLGTQVNVQIISSQVAKGVDLLVICDSAECPRAEGIDRGGWALLDAQEPGDGAWVFPGIVEMSSLDLLAAGKKAPDLCVRAKATLLDEPAAPLAFTLAIDAANGGGTVTGIAQNLKASLRLADNWGAGAEPALIHVAGAGGGQTFVGTSPLVRAKDGCWETDVIASEPLARSKAGLARSLAGKAKDTIIAKGTLHVDAGTALAHKDYPITVVGDPYGNARLDGKLFPSGHAVTEAIDVSQAGVVTIGFPLAKSFEPELHMELGAVGYMHEMSAASLAAIAAAHGGKTIVWPASVSDHGTPTVIGEFRLSYVADH
jgi:hypothetical protein